MEIDAEFVRGRLLYEASTGRLFWRANHGKARAGEEAGCLMGIGYRRISLNDRLYLAHRLAWLMVRGVWPEGQIDHINGVRSDNRMSNLREVGRAVNTQNQRKPQTRNKSGFLGVSKRKDSSRYRAQIMANGRNMWLGLFDTPEQAHAAYVEAKRALHIGNTL